MIKLVNEGMVKDAQEVYEHLPATFFHVTLDPSKTVVS